MVGNSMGSLLETMYDLLLKPQKAMLEIMQTKSLKQSLLVVLFCTMLTTWGGLATGLFSGTSQIIIVFFDMIGSLFIWGAAAAILHLFAELTGGCGQIKQLLKLLGFIYFIDVLLMPIYLVAAVTSSAGIVVVATILVWIWKGVLSIFVLKAVYDISSAKAVLVFFLPFLIFVGLFLCSMLLAGSLMMTMFNELMVNPPQI
jgi:hypothetical protein